MDISTLAAAKSVAKQAADAAIMNEKGQASGLASLDENGLIPLAQIPPTATGDILTVADDARRFALTPEEVHNGQTIRVLSNLLGTNMLYLVIDDTNLDSESGYQVYTAGRAAIAAYAETAPASGTTYDDTTTQLGANNVQGAIVALAANSGGSPYTYLTQAEYEVLETPDPDTMYWVTYPLSGDHIVWRNGEAVDSKVCENGGFAFPPAPTTGATCHRYPYSHIAIPSFSGMTADTTQSPFTYAKYVDIAKGDTNLRPYIFMKCTLLESISIPTSVTTIDDFAFSGCSGLTTVTIPSGVTTIGNNAFAGCTALTSITLPSSVTTIDFNTFKGCTALTDFNFKGTAAQWGNVTLGADWKKSAPFTVVHCTDGDSTRLS
jgi:hypothetical protein